MKNESCLISYCAISNAEVDTKVLVVLMNNISSSMIPQDRILVNAGHVNTVQRTPKKSKMKLSKIGSKNKYHFFVKSYCVLRLRKKNTVLS